MVKYFCDCCGEEIPAGNRYEVRGFKTKENPLSFSSDDFLIDRTTCEDCFDKVLIALGGGEDE